MTDEEEDRYSSCDRYLLFAAVYGFSRACVWLDQTEFMRGKKTGMLVGFLSGIMADVFWGSSLGLYALIYTLIGYLNGCFRRLFFDDDIKLPLALIAASEMIYGTFIYFCIFMLQGEFNFLFYLAHIHHPGHPGLIPGDPSHKPRAGNRRTKECK